MNEKNVIRAAKPKTTQCQEKSNTQIRKGNIIAKYIASEIKNNNKHHLPM